MPTPAEQIRALTDANAGLWSDKAQLERANAVLREAGKLREERFRLLQVVVAILLAIIASLSAELAIRMLGATAQIAFGSAVGVFFGVLGASLGILTFMGHA